MSPGADIPTPTEINPRTTKIGISNRLEGAIMTNAGQAFLLSAEVFCLSFFAIFLFWFAERLRGGSARKPPR
jgi:hypothetical protein